MMRNLFRLFALTMFLAASVAYVGCQPSTPPAAPAESDAPDSGSGTEEDKTSSTTTSVGEDMVLVSLKVPNMV